MKPLRVTRKLLDSSFQRNEVARMTQLLAGLNGVVAIFLFGSAAELKATDQSDFDFLIVIEDSSSWINIRKTLRSHLPLSRIPVDIIWKRKSEFLKQREVGGVSMVAWEEGICTFSSDEKVFGPKREL